MPTKQNTKKKIGTKKQLVGERAASPGDDDQLLAKLKADSGSTAMQAEGIAPREPRREAPPQQIVCGPGSTVLDKELDKKNGSERAGEYSRVTDAHV